MAAQHLGNLLHRLEARAHDLHAPLVEERPGPIDGAVVPEVIKPFPEQHGPNRPEVVLDKLPEAGALIARLMLSSFQEEPARLREQRLSPSLSERADFRAPDAINGVAHVPRDVKAVQDVEGMSGFLRDDLQIGLPHVAADERECGGALLPEPAEKPEQCLGASVLPDPQQPFPRGVDLIDERRKFAPCCQWISSMPIARIPVRST